MNTVYGKSSLGILKVIYEGNILYGLQVVQDLTELMGMSSAQQINKKNQPLQGDFPMKVLKQIEEYVEGKRKQFDLNLRLEGTEFQEKVWEALYNIPYGETKSYGEIAMEIGSADAARAVGAACHNNPIWLVIPCHRVVGKSGDMTGYAYGTEMKIKLLSIESNNKE